MQNRITIIGAGLAGLTVAYELSKYDKFDVTVYEAEPRVGGRIQSIVADSVTYDTGAFMIFPWYKHLKNLLHEINLSKDLCTLATSRQFFERTGAGKKGYAAFSRTPLLDLLPPKLIRGLLLPTIKHKTSYYEPDLSYFSDTTLENYIHSYGGVGSGAEKMLQQLLFASGFPNFKTLSLGLNVGLAQNFMRSRGFDGVNFIRGGTQRITDTLAEIASNKAVKFRLGAKIQHIEDKKIYLSGSAKPTDVIVYTNGLHDNLIQQTLAPETDSISAAYAVYYACVISTDNTPIINGFSKWMAVYNDRGSTQKPQIASILNVSESMNLSAKNKLIVYLSVNHSDIQEYSEDSIVQIINRELKKTMPKTGRIEALAVKRWDNIMPVIAPSTVKILKNKQGQNGYYYAGDFLGSPSMETSVYSGRKIAAKIIAGLPDEG